LAQLATGVSDAFMILLLVFRAAWVAALPIITAIAGGGTGLLTVMLLSHAISIPSTALTLAALIGLGVGIDYALFIVNRHLFRELGQPIRHVVGGVADEQGRLGILTVLPRAT
jgi:uncharacterized membrane protein YdfJ with MMPL/SSD domain